MLSFLGTLIKVSLPLMKKVLTTLAKSAMVRLGLTTAASATDAAIQKTVFESGVTTLIDSCEKVNDIVRTEPFEESSLLIKGVSETVRNDAKNWISWHVIRYIRCQFIRKYVKWEK